MTQGHHGHSHTLTLEETLVPKGNVWRKLPPIFAIIGAGALVLAYVLAGDGGATHGAAHAAAEGVADAHAGGGENHSQFFFSYLTSFMFWLSMGVGGLFFTLIHHGTRAGWSTVVRRIAENYMIVLPLFGLLIIPVLLGAHDLFHWTHEDVVANDLVLQSKAGYLDEGFFMIRAVVVIAIWSLLALVLYRWSTRQDTEPEGESKDKLTYKMRWIAPLGFVLFTLTITVAALDWMMSLDPHWYSTIFGVYYFAGTVMVIMVAITLSGIALQSSGLIKDAISTEHYHDLGKYAFAFMVFWSYIAFSQFMLIWYANIPEETIWYGHRMEGGWEYVTLILALSHFAIPFFFLMSRHIKRKRVTLVASCIFLLFAHYVDLFWLIQPNMALAQGAHPHFSFHISDLLCLIGIGGLFLSVYTWRTAAKPVVAIGDPRLEESLAFENY